MSAWERIRIDGTVADGGGTLVRDVLIEIWQGNAAGRYDSGVCGSDTIKPGRVTGRNGRPMVPHINLWIVARGINLGLNTRLYFSDEAAANEADPVLKLIEWQVRRNTLMAQRDVRDSAVVSRFDIRLQGEGEAVFFDI